MEPPPVRYVTTRDGVNIAYSVSGAGRPLVFLGPALGGMAHLWRFFPEWMEGLSARFRLVQHDLRGHGMSERGLAADFGVGDDENAIEAILDRLHLDRFVMLGLSGVGHVAIRYAAAHPERVEGLVLSGTPISAGMPSFWRGLSAENWEFFLQSFVPPARSPEESRLWVEGLKESTTYNDWQIRARIATESNIEAYLPLLRVPTLVLRPRDEALSSSEAARNLASRIPGARLVFINGDRSLGDATEGIAAIEQFLAELELAPAAAAPVGTAGVPYSNLLSGRETEILRLLSAGRSNKAIAAELVISVRTVERHINHIYEKAGVANRAGAATYAAHHGIA